MKIYSKKFDLNLVHSFQTAHGADDIRHNAYVKIEEDGFEGFGEAAPLYYYNEYAHTVIEAVEKYKNINFGDFRNFRDVTEKMWMHVEGEYAAKAALDMAVYDMAGKASNLPLYKLAGINPENTPVTSYTIGIDTPEVIERKVLEAVEYPILKVKLGAGNDEDIMKCIRKLTDKTIRVDANCGWTVDEAVRKVQWLQDINVEFIEQPLPVDNIEGIKKIREVSKIPIIADESSKRACDIPGLFGAYDGINIKLMKCGGITEALKMIAMARTLNMKIMIGCMVETSLAVSAAAHLTPLVDYADLDGNLLIKNDQFTGVKVKNGKLILNDKPGLGVTCNEDFWN